MALITYTEWMAHDRFRNAVYLQVFLNVVHGALEVALVRVAEDDVGAFVPPVEVGHHCEGDESDCRLQLGVLRVDQEDHASALALLRC